LKELRRKKAEEEYREKIKKEALAKLELNKARKAAVVVIEDWWYKVLCKRGLRRARERLKKLPYDCRILWIKLNCAKAQTFYLKQEIDNLVNKKTVSS